MTEREWDRALHIQTMGREDESGAKYMPYEPTPYPVLLRLRDQGGIRADDCMLDYGCGKGRAAFFLAAQIGCRAVGVDHSEKLIAIAEENRAGFAWPERVRFVHGRAERYAPEEENVFFFFNPFSEGVLQIVLRRILRAWSVRGERMRMYFYYPSDGFLACLAAEPLLVQSGEIDCRDLFDGNKPQERILIYETAEA